MSIYSHAQAALLFFCLPKSTAIREAVREALFNPGMIMDLARERGWTVEQTVAACECVVQGGVNEQAG